MKPDPSIFNLLRDFWPHVSPRRRKQLVLLVLLMLLGAIAELVTIGAVIPFISLMANPESAFQFPFLQWLFSLLGWQDPADIMTPMIVLFLTIIISATGVRLLLLWASNRYVYALGYDVGVSLYSRTLNQPYHYHINTNTSEIIAAVNKVQAVLNGAVKPVLDGIIALALGFAIIGTLLYIQPVAMAIAAGVFLGGYLAAGRFTQKRLRSNGKLIARAHTDRVRCVQEGLGGIRDIILDSSQDQITRTFAKADQRLRRGQASNSILNQAPRYLIEAIGIFLIIGLALFLSRQEGGLVPVLPILGALALGAQRLLPLLQKVYKAWAKMTGNQQLFADIIQMLDLPKPTRKTTSGDRVRFQRHIQLKGIGFRYDPGRELVLDNVNLTIPKGSRIGIIGPTGSGKSTLADIIMGLLEPTEGRLLVDGVEITKLNQEAWRRCISHVPQHIFLADCSVAENIATGVPIGRIDMARLRESARAARIADFIEASPDGYQAAVGERGIQLSGGQRQRLGIARALYRNAEVLMLDEATSALDSTTESDLMGGLSETAGHVTTIMIAHRTSTLAQCDLIVKLDAGRIVSLGSYEQIMEGQSDSEQADAHSVKIG